MNLRTKLIVVALIGLVVTLTRVDASRAQQSVPVDKTLVVQKGTLPIILAPHGGRLMVEGIPERHGDGARKFVTVRDENTVELAQRLGTALEKRLGGKPYLVIALFARKNLDPNRPAADAYESPAAKPFYDAYHQALKEACQELQRRFGRGLLLDLHGQAAEADTIFRGTAGGKTVSALFDRFGKDALTGPRSILGHLEDQGYRVVPAKGADQKEDARFGGGHIVRTYGGAQGLGVDAIQLELGTKLRAKDRLDETAADLAAAIQVFAKEYLPPPTPRPASPPVRQPAGPAR